MYTIAHLLIVAGLACARLSTSNISLIPVDRLMRSPLAKHNTLESSRTVFRFSTHNVSTGPSRTNHFQSVDMDVKCSRFSEELALSSSPDSLGAPITVVVWLPKTMRHMNKHMQILSNY